MYITDAPANPGRFRQRLSNETVTVAVAADGIRLYDRPDAAEFLRDNDLLISILKAEICLSELEPLFRDILTAQDVLDEFNRIKLDTRMAGVDKTWRLVMMHDGGQSLARILSHHSTQYPCRYMPIAVCIRSNGVYLYRLPLGRQMPPQDKDMFLYIAPCHIEPQFLQELFPVMLAAEITAAFRFNRRQLLRVLCRADDTAPIIHEDSNNVRP